MRQQPLTILNKIKDKEVTLYTKTISQMNGNYHLTDVAANLIFKEGNKIKAVEWEKFRVFYNCRYFQVVDSRGTRTNYIPKEIIIKQLKDFFTNIKIIE